jgi:hypothetical protein
MNRRSGLILFVKFGIPAVMMSLFGTYVLATMVQTKYERYDRQNKPPSSTSSSGHSLFHPKPFDLNEELKKLEQNVDLDAWINKRVPRPEESDRKK